MFKFSSYTLLIAGFTRLANLSLCAQTGSITGRLSEVETKEAIPYSNLFLQTDSAGKTLTLQVTTSTMDGEFLFKNVSVGTYKVYSTYLGYSQKLVIGVPVREGVLTYVNLDLQQGKNITEIETVTYTAPIEDSHSKNGKTITREEYQDLATKEQRSCFPESVYSPDTTRIIKATPKITPSKRKSKKR